MEDQYYIFPQRGTNAELFLAALQKQQYSKCMSAAT